MNDIYNFPQTWKNTRYDMANSGATVVRESNKKFINDVLIYI